MAIKNIYSHVATTLKTTARKRASVEDPTLPTLFAPFVAKKGPENQAVKLYSISDFITTFGTQEYSEQGQQILNLENWLNAGGAVVACRMTKAPDIFQVKKRTEKSEPFTNYIRAQQFDKAEGESYIALNGILLDEQLTDAVETYTKATSYSASTKYYKLSDSYNTANLDGSTISEAKFSNYYVKKVSYYTPNPILDSEQFTEFTTYGTTSAYASDAYAADISNYYRVRANGSKTQIDITSLSYADYLAKCNAGTLVVKLEEYVKATSYSTGITYYTSNLNNGYDKVTDPSLDGFTDWYELTVNYNADSATLLTAEAKFPTVENNSGDEDETDGTGQIVVEYQTTNMTSVADFETTKDGESLYLDDMRLITAYALDNNLGVLIRAKYSGSYYDGMKVRFTRTSDSAFRIQVYDTTGTVVESFSRITQYNYTTVAKTSAYIGELVIANFPSNTNKFFTKMSKTQGYSIEYTLGFWKKEDSEWVSLELADFDTAYDPTLIPDAIVDALTDDLTVKCDYILDAGYPTDVKLAIAAKVASTDENTRVRDDMIFISDLRELRYATNQIPRTANGLSLNVSSSDYELRSLAMFDQHLTTEDIYSDTSGVEVYVTPTYFLAEMIPSTEIMYGPHKPIAGKEYGVLSDVISINHNPSSSEKNSYVNDHINYIERDSEGYQFMSYSTLEDDDSPLQDIQKSRMVNKFCVDIKTIGRRFLFKESSSTTLNNLQAAIENYLNKWITNKTLSSADVQVSLDEDDDDHVNVVLNLKFYGIIKIISVEINI